MSLDELVKVNGILPELGDIALTKTGMRVLLVSSPGINVVDILYLDRGEWKECEKTIHVSEIDRIIEKRK